MKRIPGRRAAVGEASPPGRAPVTSGSSSGSTAGFAETTAWQPVGEGWRPLFGHFVELGFSFEWHQFASAETLDWSRSFHPAGIEVCLNLEGTGTIRDAETTAIVRPRTSAFYHQGVPPLSATRDAGMRHRFVTVEFSVEYLRRQFQGRHEHLHPWVRPFVVDGIQTSKVSAVEPIDASLLHLVDGLRHCPVFTPARDMWFQGKALEVAAHLFFKPADGELFCTRTQRVGRERVERVRAILLEKMSEAPTLSALGRMVGCSPFYLSRLFSEVMGTTIPQYLRMIRLERAAELLRTGRCNVTEAALEVGYNSLSHFSTAFREMFGCCPGLYPLKTPSQQQIPSTRDPAGGRGP